MTRNLDIALLRAFATAADRGSMTAAAETLHLTQGAVSQQIARLEALAGRALLDRARAGLRPTPAGERLLAQARRLVALNDSVWADLGGSAAEGAVRLGVPHDLAGARLAPVLKAHAAAWPRIDLSLHCGASPDLATAIDAGRLDLALVESPWDGEPGECLAIDRLVWTGARGGQAHERRPLPVSLVAETCAFRPAVLAALEADGRPWRTQFEGGSLDATAAMVRADLAVSAWLASAIPPGLDVLPPAAGLPELPAFAISLLGGAGPAPPAVAGLADLLRDAFARPAG